MARELGKVFLALTVNTRIWLAYIDELFTPITFVSCMAAASERRESVDTQAMNTRIGLTDVNHFLAAFPVVSGVTAACKRWEIVGAHAFFARIWETPVDPY